MGASKQMALFGTIVCVIIKARTISSIYLHISIISIIINGFRISPSAHHAQVTCQLVIITMCVYH